MKTLHAVFLGLTLAATSAWPQVAVDENKSAPKKAQPTKTVDAKKSPVPKKADAPKKAGAAKSQAPKEAPAPSAAGNPNVKVFKAGAPDAPKLRDKDGKVIPTSPDAYDVSSAVKK